MSTPNSCNDASIHDGVCEVVGKLQNMSTIDNNISVCANCGKKGIDVNNICNKCKQVKYCNAVCKKKHRSKHKKECEEHLKLAAEKHDIELFKQPPPPDDCPICFQQLPLLIGGRRYQTCCGKRICSGCIYAPVFDNQGNAVAEKKCPFCRTPTPSSHEEAVERLEIRVDLDDPIAIHIIGCYYRDGRNGYPRDHTKALKLFHRAKELGHAEAYTAIGYAYSNGRGVEVDKDKALHYWELAAIRGNGAARCNLGVMEANGGNFDRAVKHCMIAVRSGFADSLKIIKHLYTCGHATKEDYMKALQLYQAYIGEIKSDQRDKAAAYNKEEYRYY